MYFCIKKVSIVDERREIGCICVSSVLFVFIGHIVNNDENRVIRLY